MRIRSKYKSETEEQEVDEILGLSDEGVIEDRWVNSFRLTLLEALRSGDDVEISVKRSRPAHTTYIL